MIRRALEIQNFYRSHGIRVMQKPVTKKRCH